MIRSVEQLNAVPRTARTWPAPDVAQGRTGLSGGGWVADSLQTTAAPTGGAASTGARAWVVSDYRNPDGLRRELSGILYQGVSQDLAGYAQYQDLVAMLNSYTGLQLESIRSLVNAANSSLEQVLILKTLAARETWGNLVNYANEIRGQSEQLVFAWSTMRDDQDLMQQWQDSCGPAVVQLLAGETNPRFAWESNKWSRLAQVDPYGSASGLASQQKQWLEESGGVAVPRGQTGGRGIAIDNLLNRYLPATTGVRYQRYAVTSPQQSLEHLAQILVAGYDVPIRVERSNGSGHFMLVTGVRRGTYDREFRLHDPDTGRTRWVSNADIAANQLTQFFSGTSRFSHYYAPAERA